MPKKRNDIRHMVVLALLVIPLSSFGQTNANLRGVVTLTGKATPLHGVTVRIVELGRAVITDEKGAYDSRRFHQTRTRSWPGWMDFKMSVRQSP